MVCCSKYWRFGMEWDSKLSYKLDLQGNPSPYSALDVLTQTVPVKIFVPVVKRSYTHSPLITGFSVSQTGIGRSSRVPVRAILQWPNIVCPPPCCCAGSVSGQENSGVSARRQGLVEARAPSQTAMGGPVFSAEPTYEIFVSLTHLTKAETKYL